MEPRGPQEDCDQYLKKFAPRLAYKEAARRAWEEYLKCPDCGTERTVISMAGHVDMYRCPACGHASKC